MFDTYSDIFKERALEYHSAMTASPRARDAEFRTVVQPIADALGGLVCDMPAGGGYLMRYLPPQMRYVGVDPADEFLNSAPESSSMIKAAIDDVPLPDGSVDYVLSLAGLHHEENLDRVFAEMRRLLRQGGRVVVADAAEDTPPARFLNGFVDRNNPMGHQGRFLDGATAPALEAVGLAVVADEVIEVPWLFDRSDEAADFCGNLFGIATAGEQAILAALADEIGFTRANGQLLLNWQLRRILCVAV
jgi:SAM-dependent methyltransferase